ncbi:hypothetical protein EV215_0848 [Hypnocyclicus thermotrophus]|uniref:SPOR domain-containing protein n=1 Tax=Hypnocyclicus thermotrophus TaxID=1627895 RepID=A0AA46I6B5_9FUSO|nr:hypothetical protein [Hypnocyclicus thermotrophus]TDT71472.1 hypothetical protein EV215_0848 [Hypnocyclicus thermotrophus]
MRKIYFLLGLGFGFILGGIIFHYSKPKKINIPIQSHIKSENNKNIINEIENISNIPISTTSSALTTEDSIKSNLDTPFEFDIPDNFYQIQIISSNSIDIPKKVQKNLATIIDTQIYKIGNFYRLFSKKQYSIKLASDLAKEIKSNYKYNPVIWKNNYKVIFLKSKDKNEVYNINNKINTIIDTQIIQHNKNFLLVSKYLIAENLAKDLQKDIKKRYNLDIILKKLGD